MKIKIKEVCLYGILGALLFVLKFAMSSLPNIEPVSLFLISYTLVFGIKAVYPLTVYVILEILIYGFGFWSIGYLYIWLILIVVVLAIYKITKITNPLFWASVNGMFGLSFGALYIPLYTISGGFKFAIAWWISGLPYDFTHCIANFIICIVLFRPLTSVLLRLKK